MLAKFLASRLAGHLVVGLGAATIATGAFAGLQTYRLGNAQELAASRAETIDTLEDRVRSDAGLIQQRDLLIQQQNASIAAISAQRQEDRTVYLQGYARADERARDNDERAQQIMALPNEQLDELASCRASRILLEDELTR